MTVVSAVSVPKWHEIKYTSRHGMVEKKRLGVDSAVP